MSITEAIKPNSIIRGSILSPEQICDLQVTPEQEPFDRDAARFRLGIEAMRLGLVKRELNLSAIVGKTAEAKECRLVPEVIEDFSWLPRPFSVCGSKPSPLTPRSRSSIIMWTPTLSWRHPHDRI